MIKIKYNPEYSFSNAEIFDASDDEIIFFSKTRLPGEWASLGREFYKNNDIIVAMQMLALAITAIQQDGEKYIISGLSDIESMRDGLEAKQKGLGNEFVSNLAIGHFNHHWARIDDKIKNSKAPLSTLNNGATPKKSKSAAKQE